MFSLMKSMLAPKEVKPNTEKKVDLSNMNKSDYWWNLWMIVDDAGQRYAASAAASRIVSEMSELHERIQKLEKLLEEHGTDRK